MTPIPSRTCLASVVLAIAASTGCKNDTPPAGEAPATASQGPAPGGSSTVLGMDRGRVHALDEKARAPDFEMRVHRVKECKVDAYHRPRQGNVKLGVEVWIRATTDREVPVNPFNATLTDGRGNQYNMAFGGCQPGLKSVRLRKGDETRGFVTFEIPERARDLVIEFRPFVLRTGNEPVRFDLDR